MFIVVHLVSTPIAAGQNWAERGDAVSTPDGLRAEHLSVDAIPAAQKGWRTDVYIPPNGEIKEPKSV